jgi:hypothetical protein
MHAIYAAFGACLGGSGTSATAPAMSRCGISLAYMTVVRSSDADVKVLLSDDDAERAGAVARILATGPGGNAG